MKRRLCLLLAVLLLLGLTACGGAQEVKETTEPANPAVTTEPMETAPALVDVEVLTKIVYYDENKIYSNYAFELDEMGRVINEVHTDSEGNILEEYTYHWNDDKSFTSEGTCFIPGSMNTISCETKGDPEFGRCTVWVHYSGEEIMSAELLVISPYGEQDRYYLDAGEYRTGDWEISGWQYSTDQEGNLLCWIEVTTVDGTARMECMYSPNGDLLYCIRKTDGAMTSFEEVSYDEKGRPVRHVKEDNSVQKWTYNDAANTGEWTHDIWNGGQYAGYWFEEYVYDRNGNIVTAYGKWYGSNGQPGIDSYTQVYAYDENNVLRSCREIDNNSGEVTVRTYDAHGNQILTEYYNGEGSLERMSRTDYIYTTIQVTAEAAEKYHTGK